MTVLGPLFGSTKIISIAVFYSDFFIGLPIRLTFGFINDRLVKSGAGRHVFGAAAAAAAAAVVVVVVVVVVIVIVAAVVVDVVIIVI